MAIGSLDQTTFMHRFILHIIIFFFGIVYNSELIFAQEINATITDDLGNVSDAFQENFFEALKQKGIENYELALIALEKAEKAANKNPEHEAVVFFETGKNLKYLKRYEEAEENFQKVLQSQGERLDVLEALYDLYYLQHNYTAAIPLVQKLIKIDEDYKEDLANLYSRTKQYDKGLELLDELDESWGESTYRNALRRQIYRISGNTEGAIENLETKIDKNPKKEHDYLKLIYLYSEQGDTEKAFETAKELLRNQPKSQLAHLALYKFYLEEGNTVEAMKSMNVVFASSKINNENKYKVLADFLEFLTKNPDHEADINEIISQFSNQGSGQVYERLGDYYLAKGDKDAALRFYERGVRLDEDNFSLLKNTLLLQIDVSKFEEAASLSENALTIFPAQALFYLLNGVANNGLNMADEAIASLEMGMDFVLDDPKMEKDFYEQLSRAYTIIGDHKKAGEFTKKASEMKLQN
jgi:tetratricopeptide (TPR) repeat protein